MNDMITQVWFKNVDGTSGGELQIGDLPRLNRIWSSIRIPGIGEHISWRGATVGADDNPIIETVVDIKTFYYKSEHDVWVQEIHVMTSARD